MEIPLLFIMDFVKNSAKSPVYYMAILVEF